MSGAVYTASEVLVAIRCGECGVWFGLTEFFQEKRQETGKNFYCPNGHSRVYRESDVVRLTRERDEANRRARANRDLLEAEERSHSATKGVVTKLKKRASAGVCPCCHRTFQNVQRHMVGQHPDFVEAAS